MWNFIYNLFISSFLNINNLGGKIIPKDANLVISQYCLGQRPELFYRPEEFIPERFIEKEYHYYSFLPFSAGQR